MRLIIPWSGTESDEKVVVINNADPETFEVKIVENYPVPQGNTYQGWLAKDKGNVYYRDSIIEFADPQSFVVTDSNSINYDKNNVYLRYEVLPNADPSSYKVAFDTSTSKVGVVFGRDLKNCYQDYKIISCDNFPETFQQAFELTDDSL